MCKDTIFFHLTMKISQQLYRIMYLFDIISVVLWLYLVSIA